MRHLTKSISVCCIDLCVCTSAGCINLPICAYFILSLTFHLWYWPLVDVSLLKWYHCCEVLYLHNHSGTKWHQTDCFCAWTIKVFRCIDIPMLTLTFGLPMLPIDIIMRFYMTLYILDIIHGKCQGRGYSPDTPALQRRWACRAYSPSALESRRVGAIAHRHWRVDVSGL